MKRKEYKILSKSLVLLFLNVNLDASFVTMNIMINRLHYAKGIEMV